MTLVTLPTDLYYPRPIIVSGTAPTAAAYTIIDAAGEYLAYVFRAHEAMTTSHVAFMMLLAAGTVDVRIEPVDATTGVPTGALWATNTNLSAASSIGWNLFALTAAASIAKDDWYAIKWLYAGSASRVAAVFNWSSALSGLAIPYQVTVPAGATAVITANVVPNLALGSSATSFYNIPYAVALSAINTRTQNNTGTGRFGARFQVPFKCRCRGIQLAHGGTASDFKVMMMDDAGSELSSSQLLYDGNIRVAGAYASDHQFANPVTLDANTWYRAVVEPQTATNVTMYTYTLPSADYSETSWWGSNKAHYITYTSGGGWIDTATTEIPRIALIFDQLDDGASVGGGGVSRARVQLGH